MEVELKDLEKVIDNAEKIAFGKVKPTKDEVDQVFKIVVDYFF